MPPYKRNDFGYTIGGPVFIPGFTTKIRHKTFFFFSEEWRREIDHELQRCRSILRGTRIGRRIATSPQSAFGDFSEPCAIAAAEWSALIALLTSTARNSFPKISYPSTQMPCHFWPCSRFQMRMTQTTRRGLTTDPSSLPTKWREELFQHRPQHQLQPARHPFATSMTPGIRSSPVPLWTNGGSYPTIQNTYGQPSTSVVAHVTATRHVQRCSMSLLPATPSNHITFQNIGAWQRPDGYNLGLFQNGFGGGKLPGIQLNGGTSSTALHRTRATFPMGRSTLIQATPIATT